MRPPSGPCTQRSFAELHGRVFNFAAVAFLPPREQPAGAGSAPPARRSMRLFRWALGAACILLGAHAAAPSPGASRLAEEAPGSYEAYAAAVPLGELASLVIEAEGAGALSAVLRRVGSLVPLRHGLDGTGVTLQMAAAATDSFATMKLSLRAGCASASEEDARGYSALHYAALGGSNALAALLQACGHALDLEAGDLQGRTPLMVAARAGRSDAVKMLLYAGADPLTKADDRRDALFAAAHMGRQNCTELLLQGGADPTSTDRNGESPLHVAARFGFLPVVQSLVASGAPVDRAAKDGVSVLIAAARGGREDVVRFLVERGADPHATTRDGSSALHLAAQHGHRRAVAALLDAGARVNRGNELGVTPLMLAAQHAQAQVVPLLLHAGAEILARSSHGATALQLAVDNKNEAIVEMLEAELRGELPTAKALPGPGTAVLTMASRM